LPALIVESNGKVVQIVTNPTTEQDVIDSVRGAIE
jgi:hypothetical protein